MRIETPAGDPGPGPETRAEPPALPDGLYDLMNRDASGEAVEGRALSDEAMARATGAYMMGEYDVALMHAERASAAGEPRGATLAGHIRLHGLAGGRDDAAALRWFRRAAEHGEPDALIAMAGMASESRAGLSPSEADAFLRRAAESGDAQAALAYGLHLRRNGDPGAAQSALDWLRLAAESGHVDAFLEYAEALDQWVHGPRDPALARPWYERAGDAGDALGAMQAGLMYIHGEGGEADPAVGVALIRRAAELGLPGAMGEYALILYSGGYGEPRDPDAAADWAGQGARSGDPMSQFLYAYALASGEGAAVDRERAYFWAVRSGLSRGGALRADPDRRGLETALRADLPPETAAQLRSQARAAEAAFDPGAPAEPVEQGPPAPQ